MSFFSDNEYTADGRLLNGYDYDRQAWVLKGVYVGCGHPVDMDCRCYGKLHAGETQELAQEVDRILDAMGTFPATA